MKKSLFIILFVIFFEGMSYAVHPFGMFTFSGDKLVQHYSASKTFIPVTCLLSDFGWEAFVTQEVLDSLSEYSSATLTKGDETKVFVGSWYLWKNTITRTDVRIIYNQDQCVVRSVPLVEGHVLWAPMLIFVLLMWYGIWGIYLRFHLGVFFLLHRHQKMHNQLIYAVACGILFFSIPVLFEKVLLFTILLSFNSLVMLLSFSKEGRSFMNKFEDCSVSVHAHCLGGSFFVSDYIIEYRDNKKKILYYSLWDGKEESRKFSSGFDYNPYERTIHFTFCDDSRATWGAYSFKEKKYLNRKTR